MGVKNCSFVCLLEDGDKLGLRAQSSIRLSKNNNLNNLPRFEVEKGTVVCLLVIQLLFVLEVY